MGSQSSSSARRRVKQATMHATQHFVFRNAVCEVGGARMVHELLREVFAQFVTFAQFSKRHREPAARVGVQGDERGRNLDLIVIGHARCYP
jgi:hypothetical protein